MNKILKAYSVKLQGFIIRAVGNNSDGDPTMHKMEFVMRETFIRNFYFLELFSHRKKLPNVACVISKAVTRGLARRHDQKALQTAAQCQFTTSAIVTHGDIDMFHLILCPDYKL